MLVDREAVTEQLAVYIRLKWAIFPTRRDKIPLTRHGYQDATVNPEQINEWAQRFPDCNWSVATGRISGVIALDVDGPQGEDSLYKLGQEGILITSPLEVVTGRGRHLYFKDDRTMRNSTGKLGPGLDIRANGGSITVPPSVHKTGARYEWLGNPEQPIPHLPLALLLHLYKPKVKPTYGVAPTLSLAEIVSRLTSAAPGTRNYELNVAAFMAGKIVRAGGVSMDEAEHTLVETGISIGLDRHECRATVRSGIAAGQEA